MRFLGAYFLGAPLGDFMRRFTLAAALSVSMIAGCSDGTDGVTQDQLDAAIANMVTFDDMDDHVLIPDAHHAPVTDASALITGILDSNRLPLEVVFTDDLDEALNLLPGGEPSGAVGYQNTQFTSTVIPDTQVAVELARITVDPSSAADIALMGHAYIERAGDSVGRIQLLIRRDDCDGDVLGLAMWRTGEVSGGFVATTMVSTGFIADIDAPTDIVLCGDAFDAVASTAYVRGLVAHW
jgi:hypothetical protein